MVFMKIKSGECDWATVVALGARLIVREVRGRRISTGIKGFAIREIAV